jgi:hypothetical protein
MIAWNVSKRGEKISHWDDVTYQKKEISVYTGVRT